MLIPNQQPKPSPKPLKLKLPLLMGTAVMGLIVLALTFRRKKKPKAETVAPVPEKTRDLADDERRKVMQELGRAGAKKRWAEKKRVEQAQDGQGDLINDPVSA